MTFEEIKQLLEIVREHELSEFELEREDFKIRIRRQAGAPVVTLAAPVAPSMPLVAASVPSSPPAAPPVAPPPIAPPDEDDVLVTPEGCEVLTTVGRDLRVC